MLGKLAKKEEWKSKYCELVEELEAKEQDWTTLQNTLRTAVVRLAIAATGQHQRLDQELRGIRDIVKEGLDAGKLSHKIDRLTRTLTRLDLSRDQTETDAQANSEGHIDTELNGFIGQLHLSVESQRRFAKRLNLSTQDIRRHILTDLAGELNQHLNPSLEQTTPASEKPLETKHEWTQPDLSPLIGTLAKEFQAIPELQESMNQIHGRLDSGIDENEWEDVLGELADSIGTVIHSIRAEKSELEEFLTTVTEQLAEFEKWTAWQQDDAQGRHDESVVLQDAVTKQVLDLHEDMQVITDITDLKGKVQNRLDNVAEQIRAFRALEETRLSDTLRRNSELQEEIKGLKGKTDKLVKLWGQQRNRLVYDTLTQVYSRYAYDQRLVEEFQRWRRHGEPLVYSMWDIDYFKKVNDTYGHRAGDRLLQLVAGMLSDNTRTEDFLARIGGEEFVLLLPNTEPTVALQIANKLRERVTSTYFHHKGIPENITISCGLTHFRDDDTPLVVYKRADKALYQAKEQGRNCCVAL